MSFCAVVANLWPKLGGGPNWGVLRYSITDAASLEGITIGLLCLDSLFT
jgi:hypothetical protein